MRIFISIPVFLALSACGPSPETNDPIRVEFIEGCMAMKAYQSMKAEKRAILCRCTYDETMANLSGDAQNAARFYLLEQAGVETASRKLMSETPDMAIMLDASKAIGKAVKQCR